ncbi:DUF4145 domain-containing protein [Leeuwenhoekiella sp. NPDC079379]|uniref:DUF4145 domain-containing protein n=1 Tax=Leeuwenhoekiella sp. NPDC079379 TaxID=3364122 RepID=UPI0037C81127
MKISFTEDVTKDNVVRVLCSSCMNNTKHKILKSVIEQGTEAWDSTHDFHWETDFEIIQCLGCETVSFRTHSINSEHDDHDGRSIPTIRIYPQRSKETLVVKNYMNVPFNLQRIHRETIESYNYGNLTLCGAGVRALVEGICKENRITGGNVQLTRNDGSTSTIRKTNLQGKINGLHENGKLTAENAEILHEHRFLGNEAVHELSTPSKDDLKLAIEIVENVFDTLYEIPNKGLTLKRKLLNS